MATWFGANFAPYAQASDGGQHQDGPDDRRDGLVAEAEAALSRGDAVSASESFERAAAMRHAADSEMGWVRAAMQLGEYRRALAFCAHVAGEHLDEPGAVVLYAWLLRVGGQREVAERVLSEALARAPGDPLVAEAAGALASPLPVASAPLLDRPHRVAPFATTQAGELPPPSAARVVSSGVLMPGGRHALLPGRPNGSRLWVRDGLGATRTVVLADAGDGVVTRWRLATTIPTNNEATLGKSAVAGAPVYAIEYAQSSVATPAWPWLHAGFLGSSNRDGNAFRLGVDLDSRHAGGPVLDRHGRLIGIALRDAEGRARMRPSSLWGCSNDNDSSAASPGQVAFDASVPVNLARDQIYERAMRFALQVIALE